MKREEFKNGRKRSRFYENRTMTESSTPPSSRTRAKRQQKLVEKKCKKMMNGCHGREGIAVDSGTQGVRFQGTQKHAAVELDSDNDVIFIGEFSAEGLERNSQQMRAGKSVDSERVSSPRSALKEGKRKKFFESGDDCASIISDEQDSLNNRESSDEDNDDSPLYDVDAMFEDNDSTEESTDEDNDDFDDHDYIVEDSNSYETEGDSDSCYSYEDNDDSVYHDYKVEDETQVDSDSYSDEDEETFEVRKVVETSSAYKENGKRKGEILKCSNGNLNTEGRADCTQAYVISVESDLEISSNEEGGTFAATKVVGRSSQQRENGERKDDILKCSDGNVGTAGRVGSTQTFGTPVESGPEISSDEDEETCRASKVVERRSPHKAHGKRECSKEKLKSAGKVNFLVDALANSILNAKKEEPLKRLVSLTDEPPPKQSEKASLPQKFTFEDKDEPPTKQSEKASLPQKFTFEDKDVPEQPDCENELQNLWAEMNVDGLHSGASSDDCGVAADRSKSCPKARNERSDCRKGELKSPSKVSFLNDLAIALLDKEEVPAAELVPVTYASPTIGSTKISLPPKFTFGVEKALEKSEEEKQLDKLWVDLDLELRSSEIGVANKVKVAHEEAKHKQAEVDGRFQCKEGCHKFIIDEEAGIVCKYCDLVQTEIKHMVAPFQKEEPRSSERYYSEADFSKVGDLCSEVADHSGSSTYPQTVGTVWENIPGVFSTLYPHQREGFEFIWKNIAGGMYRDKTKNQSQGGSGCIISHAPGTGKTRLVLVFIQSYMKEHPQSRPLIIAPRNMLLTWEEEFKKWEVDIPFYNLNKPELAGNERQICTGLLEKYNGDIKERDMEMIRRMVKLYSWRSTSGILGISYGLFKNLAGRFKSKLGCVLSEKMSRILLEMPELVVLDEGHTPRNEESQIWKVLTEIKTERRIILSGTPFQNNFDELFNTLSLVRPKFEESLQLGNQASSGPKRSSKKKDEGKLRWMSLTNSIAHNKFDGRQLQKLKDIMKPFVHVHKGEILDSLPGLKRFIVVLKPTDVQSKLLDALQQEKEKQFFLFEHCVSLISVHPSLVDSCSDQGIGRGKIEMLKQLAGKDLESNSKLNPDVGVKTRFLLEFIRLSEALNEKVIVFSQYIDPLNLIQDQLEAKFGWREGTELLYMDGKRDVKQRQASINCFNDPRSKAKVLLASIRACSEGINLVGGSRVVLVDVTWNPSVEKQAISRAYRLGQSRTVYIYHLILSGSIDQDKYCRQTEKGIISEKVFSNSGSSDSEGNKRSDFCNVSEDQILEKLFHNSYLKPIFESISRPRELADGENGNWIFADHEE